MSTLSMVLVDIDSKIPLDERVAYAHAQTRQILEHFAPYWDVISSMRVATPDKPPVKGEVQMRLIDRPTMDGAIGYHDTLPDGTPLAYIFTGLAKELGQPWTSVGSHEALELLADPYLRRSVQMNDGFWDLEVCDRVEQDSYVIDGVVMSNFNTPACFEPPTDLTGVKFDYLGLSTKPNEVREGGYAQKFDPAKGWTQVGQMSAYRVALKTAGIGRGQLRRDRMPSGSWFSRLLGR